MNNHINHGFWEFPEDTTQQEDTSHLYPPHKGSKNTPKQRKENKAWAIGLGGVAVGDWNPTYVLFRDCVYNVYNNQTYRPTYFGNRWVIRLYKMERGLYKDQKGMVEQAFDWNELRNKLQPSGNFPKPK